MTENYGSQLEKLSSERTSKGKEEEKKNDSPLHTKKKKKKKKKSILQNGTKKTRDDQDNIKPEKSDPKAIRPKQKGAEITATYLTNILHL